MGWRDPARERPGRQATRAGDAPPWPPIAQTQLRVGFYSEQSLRHNQAEEGAIALRENVLCEPRCGFRDAIRKKPNLFRCVLCRYCSDRALLTMAVGRNERSGETCSSRFGCWGVSRPDAQVRR